MDFCRLSKYHGRPFSSSVAGVVLPPPVARAPALAPATTHVAPHQLGLDGKGAALQLKAAVVPWRQMNAPYVMQVTHPPVGPPPLAAPTRDASVTELPHILI